MSTKQLVVGACFAIAAIIFFLFGFDLVSSTKYQWGLIAAGFVALGLCIQAWWAG
jgi:hypothetical protein